jgi:hypothetical protein
MADADAALIELRGISKDYRSLRPAAHSRPAGQVRSVGRSARSRRAGR